MKRDELRKLSPRGIVIELRLLEALTAGEAELWKALLMDAVPVGKECQGSK